MWRRVSMASFRIIEGEVVITPRGPAKRWATRLRVPLTDIVGVRSSRFVSWIYLAGAERDPLYLRGGNWITGWEALRDAGVPILASAPAPPDRGARRLAPWVWSPVLAVLLFPLLDLPVIGPALLVAWFGVSAFGPHAGRCLVWTETGWVDSP